jgi:hypothetical protein
LIRALAPLWYPKTSSINSAPSSTTTARWQRSPLNLASSCPSNSRPAPFHTTGKSAQLANSPFTAATTSPAGPSRKYSQQRAGPFIVKRRVGGLAYELGLPHTMGIHPVISVAHLAPSPDNKDLLTGWRRLPVRWRTHSPVIPTRTAATATKLRPSAACPRLADGIPGSEPRHGAPRQSHEGSTARRRGRPRKSTGGQ